MPVGDFLKTLRTRSPGTAGFGKKTETGDSDKQGMDSNEPNETPRIIKFTDEESKLFQQAKPGEDLACEVHGSLDGEGGFRVMTVSPLGGQKSYGGENEKQMADQVMQRVIPSVQPSPS